MTAYQGQDLVNRCRPLRIRVTVQGAHAHSRADLLRLLGRGIAYQLHDLLGRGGNQNLLAWIEKCINPGPGIRYQTARCTGGFKYAGWRRESDVRHRVAIEVQYHPRRTVHPIMIAGTDMSNPTYIFGQSLVSPSLSTQNESQVRSEAGGGEKEFIDPLFTIR